MYRILSFDVVENQKRRGFAVCSSEICSSAAAEEATALADVHDVLLQHCKSSTRGAYSIYLQL